MLVKTKDTSLELEKLIHSNNDGDDDIEVIVYDANDDDNVEVIVK